MATAQEPDDVSAQLVSLANEAHSAFEGFKALSPSEVTLPVLVGQISDLFGIVTDFTAFSARFATEQVQWADGVDEELQDLSDPGSSLIPADALRLKTLLADLTARLPDDASSAALKARVAEAVTFLDEVTVEEGEEGEEPGDEDDDADDVAE